MSVLVVFLKANNKHTLYLLKKKEEEEEEKLGACPFKSHWSGRWFQSQVPHHIVINGSMFDTKGLCIESKGDKFIIEDR
ncbi:unnamed protein product [Bemisia tabaci]|uniref:DUF7044 domain-containing protein n=1 Tax=Bemisia tabaci TaxID=7038 RepID=A0A9P0AAN5_BEMTA|nr:unnamed protein product [Bemisia tabaci]